MKNKISKEVNNKKLYKVIKNGKSLNENFDWEKYLPKNNKVGKWTPKIKNVKLCNNGFHVTNFWNMWYETGCDVFECECKGLIVELDEVVVDKFVCESVRLVKKVSLVFDKNGNTGDRNTGSWNTGDRNTGYRNTGNMNTGNWNTKNNHVGNFNTKPPTYIELFNKPIKKSVFDKISFPNYFFFELKKDYKQSWKQSFEQANKIEIKQTIKLPNFNYTIFEEITGITKVMIQRRLK